MGFLFPKLLDSNGRSPDRENEEKKIRVVHNGKLYDVTSFANHHPGGKDVLEQHNGQDLDTIMQDSSLHSHSKTAYTILEKYLIGPVDSLEQLDDLSDQSASRHEEYYKNDIVDWNKPILEQVGHLGDKYFDWTHEQVDRPLRLFESDFFETFSKAPWWIPPIIWTPVVLLMLSKSYSHLSVQPEIWPQNVLGIQHGPLSIPALFVIGILTWTLLEYVIHRWVFHLRPPTRWPFLIVLHFSLHGQHHKSPMDPMRLVFPPVPASLFALLFYLICIALFPGGMAQAAFAGLVSGYLGYDMTHYYVHHGSPSLRYLQQLKKYHTRHHYEHQQLGFGISSKLWDYPFGTLIPDVDSEKSK